MKAVFSGLQLGHDPKRYLSRGHIIDFPEQPERARRLLQGARDAGADVIATRSFPERHLHTIHPRRYIEFLKNAHQEWLQAEDAYPEVMPSLRPIEGPAGYPDSILGRAGFHMMDFSCPIVAKTYKSVVTSAHTALTAAERIRKGDRAAYALCRPPGHHAYRQRASGFCFLNNTAIATQYLRENHERIAILDIDVHHGNGTQGIFYDRSDILTLSIHADPNQYYPFYYGYQDQAGRGEGEGYNMNIPLPVRSGDSTWQEAVSTAVECIEDYQPGALVLALGLDAHVADPLAGGAVTTDGFRKLAKLIAQLQLPTLIVQEGGYLTDYLAGNLTAFLEAFEEEHSSEA